jgi:hypothetical protein
VGIQMRNEPSRSLWNQNRNRGLKSGGGRAEVLCGAEEADYVHHANLAYASAIIGADGLRPRRRVVAAAPHAQIALPQPLQS